MEKALLTDIQSIKENGMVVEIKLFWSNGRFHSVPIPPYGKEPVAGALEIMAEMIRLD